MIVYAFALSRYESQKRIAGVNGPLTRPAGQTPNSMFGSKEGV